MAEMTQITSEKMIENIRSFWFGPNLIAATAPPTRGGWR